MTESASRDRRPTWLVLAGAVIGLAIGIVVGVTTDIPFAPEAGLVLGALAGWLWARQMRKA